MAEYLLEIGCEEVPARFMGDLLAQLQANMTQALTHHRIGFESVRSMGTYRRLVVVVAGIAMQQQDETREIKGPPVAIAKDKAGQFLPPALGFAKKVGVSPDQLEELIIDGQSVLGVRQFVKGQATVSILSDVVALVLTQFKLPIAMKWGTSTQAFFRPVHWMVSLLDGDVVPVQAFDVTADCITYGHRFLTQHPEWQWAASGVPISVSHVREYESALESHFVCVDVEKRRERIVSALRSFQATLDDSLIEENTFLTEWPHALDAMIDDRFLTLPPAVLIECIRKHQKYFVVQKGDALTGHYIMIADNVSEKSKASILAGNQKVLNARLSDVAFFWEADLKTAPQDRLDRLKAVVYQEGLGSVYDKVQRLKQLATALIHDLDLSVSQSDILRSVELCKTDLVSQMVYELPALQGIMGRLYAAQFGENDHVAQAIEQHYWPRFSGDRVPDSVVAAVVAIADKLDTIAACFYNGLVPTGSQDPWGVRRAIFGILAILDSFKWTFDFSRYLNQALTLFGPSPKAADKLMPFVISRVQSYLKDRGFDYDVVDAVSEQVVLRYGPVLDVAQAFQHWRATDPDQLKQLSELAVRVKRLATKHETNQPVNGTLFEHASEQQAYDMFQSLSLSGSADELNRLSALLTPMTAYFDSVLVMAENEALRHNRLAFLNDVHRGFWRFADFEKLVF